MGQYWTRKGDEEFEAEKTINPFEEKRIKSDRNNPRPKE
jgi:hypothetical protein